MENQKKENRLLTWLRTRTRSEWISGLTDAAMLIALWLFAFYVNRDIVIKGLYMDDLYMWSCYGEQSLLEFAFPIGTSTRFRPVYWLATYLQMAVIGNHVNWFVPFNIVCNIAVAYLLFYICRRVSECRWLSFGAAVCYLASRFAYYQIGQALGLMETLALFLAILILYLLYRFLNADNHRTAAELIAAGEGTLRGAAARAGNDTDSGCPESARSAERNAAESADGKAAAEAAAKERGNRASGIGALAALLGGGNGEEEQAKKALRLHWVKCSEPLFYGALLLYFLVVFVHERYMSLFPLFYLVLICKLIRHTKTFRREYFRENLRLWIAPLAVGVLIVLIRTLCIGTAMPAGTGGTEVTETFYLKDAIAYACEQVLYLFGINAGPEYLCGLPWGETPVRIKALIKISILALGVITAMYGIVMLLNLTSGEKKDRAAFWRSFENALLFAGFIAMCIGCSSVTIRLEMRWIYVSYAAALIFAAYMIRIINESYARAVEEEDGSAGVGAAETAGGKTKQAEDEAVSHESMQPNADNAGQGKSGKRLDAAETEHAEGEIQTVPLGAEETELLAREKRGNIFARSTLTVADRLLQPRVIQVVLALIFAFYCALSVYTNVFYRSYYPKLYFWPNQLRMNSLAEETIEKYGREGVFGKDIYILENSYEMSQFYADTFFKTFDPEKKAEGTEVHFVESTEDIPPSVIKSGELLVLEEVPEDNAYRDVTAEVLGET